MITLQPFGGYGNASVSAFGATGEFECRIITSFDELQELATAWDRLWQSNPNAEFFQRYDWAKTWWQSFSNGFTLCVPVVYEHGAVVLILPLVQHGSKLRFLGSPQADYCDMLCSHPNPEQPLSVALDILLQLADGWKECILEPLRPDSQVIRAHRKLPHRLRHLMQIKATDSCPTILLGEKRDQVIKSLLVGKHIRRRLQKLHRAGIVTFRHIENRQEAQEQLAQFFQCHRRRCAMLAKTSCFEQTEMQAMLQALVAQLDLKKELRLGVLELNGQPLAWSIGFEANGKYAYYQQTFDVDAEEYAPGEALLYYLLSYAKENVEKEFDFLRGDEFFKKRFANQLSNCHGIYVERPGARGHLRSCLRLVQGKLFPVNGRVQRFIRTHQAFFAIFRSIWIWKRNVLRRARWAARTGELRNYLLTSGLDVLCDFAWNRREATLFQMEVNKDFGATPHTISDPEITLSKGRFSDLADLTLEHPGIPLPGFREYRARLKKGDQAYLFRRRGKLALVAWAGIRSLREVSRANSNSSLSDNHSVVVMYDCRPICDPVPSCVELMSMLTAKAGQMKTDLVICCPAIPKRSRIALQRQGFFFKSRMVHHRFFHWLRYVSNSDQPDELQSADPAWCPKLKDKTLCH